MPNDHIFSLTTRESGALIDLINSASEDDLKQMLSASGDLEMSEFASLILDRRQTDGPFESLGALQEALGAEAGAAVMEALSPVAGAALLSEAHATDLLNFANGRASRTSADTLLPHRTHEAIKRARLVYKQDFEHLMELFHALEPEDRGDIVAALQDGGTKADPETMEALGLDRVEALSLSDIGVTDKSGLAKVGLSEEMRRETARVTGLDPVRLTEIGQMAALTEVPGLDAEDAELLQFAGIIDPVALAQIAPAVLLEYLVTPAERLQRQVTLDQVRAWHAAAEIYVEGSGADADDLSLETAPLLEEGAEDGDQAAPWDIVPGLDRNALAEPPRDIGDSLLQGAAPDLGRLILGSDYTGQQIADIWINPTPKLWRDPDLVRGQGILANPFVSMAGDTPDPQPITCKGSAGADWTVGLPFQPVWWGPLGGTKEPDAPGADTPGQGGGGPVAVNGAPNGLEAVPVDPPNKEEVELIEEALRHARRAKMLRDEKKKRKKEKIRDRHKKRRDRIKEERRRRRARRRYRQRRQREQNLRKRRQDLNDRRRDLQNRREGLKNQREQNARRDQELREEESRLRRGPPSDPNCQSPACQQTRQDRVANQQERYRNMRESDALDRTSRDLARDERAWRNDHQSYEDALDRGFGQTRSEFRERKLEQRLREGRRQLQSLKNRAAEIDAIKQNRALSPSEQAERDALERNISRGEDTLTAAKEREALEKAQQELDRLDGLLRNETLTDQERADLNERRSVANVARGNASRAYNEAYKETLEGQYRDTFYENAMGEPYVDEANTPFEDAQWSRNAAEQFEDGELGFLETELDRAVKEMDRAIDATGKPWLTPKPGAHKRSALAEIEERIRNANLHEEAVRNRIETLRDSIDRAKSRRAQIRDRLRQMGSSVQDTTFHGPPDQMRDVEELRQEFRDLESQSADWAQDIRQAQSEGETVRETVRDLRNRKTLFEPGAAGEEMLDETRTYNESYGDILTPDGQIDDAKARKFLRDALRGMQRAENQRQGVKRLGGRAKEGVSLRLRPGGHQGQNVQQAGMVGQANQVVGAGSQERQAQLQQMQLDLSQTLNDLSAMGIAQDDSGAMRLDQGNPLLVGLHQALTALAGRADQPGAGNAPAPGQATPEETSRERARREKPMRMPKNSAPERKRDSAGQAAESVRTVLKTIELEDEDQETKTRLKMARDQYVIDWEKMRILLPPPADPNDPNKTLTVFRSLDLSQILSGTEAHVRSGLGDRFKTMVLERNRRLGAPGTGIETATETLKDFFVNHAIAKAWRAQDWTTVTRLQQRYVNALTQMRQTVERMDAAPAGAALSSIEAELTRARQTLAESFQNLATRADRVGRSDDAAIFRSYAVSLDTRLMIEEGRGSDPETLIRDLEAKTDVPLADALDGNDLDTAERLLMARLDGWNAVTESLVGAAQTVSDDAHRRMAADLHQLAHLYTVRSGEQTDPEATKTRQAADQAKLLSATHLLQASDIDMALELIDGADSGGDGLRKWRLTLLSNALAQVDGFLGQTQERARFTQLRWQKNRLLRILGETAEDPETQASALVGRSDLERRLGDTAEAERLLGRAREVAPQNIAVILKDLERVLRADVTAERLRELVDVLTRVPSEQGAAIDASTTLHLFKKGLSEDLLKTFEQAIESSSIPEPRKSMLLLFAGRMLLSMIAAGPDAVSALPPQIQKLRALMSTANLTNGQVAALTRELSELEAPIVIYNTRVAAFQAGTLPPEDYPQLILLALAMNDGDLIKAVTTAYAADDEVDPVTRLHTLAVIVEEVQTRADQLPDAALKQRFAALVDEIKALGETTGQPELARIEDDLVTALGRKRAAQSRVDEGDGSIAYPILFGVVGYLAMKKDDREHADAITSKEAADVRIRSLSASAGEIAKARFELQMTGAAKQARGLALTAAIAEAKHAMDQIEVAYRTREGQITDDVDLASTYAEIDGFRARMLIAEVEWETFDTIWRKDNPVIDAWNGFRHVRRSSVEDALLEIQRTLNGYDNPSPGVSRARGLRRKVEAHQTHRSLWTWEEKENQHAWRMTWLKDRLERVETRRTRLVLSGPDVDPRTGRDVSPHDRIRRLAELLDDDLKNRQAQAHAYGRNPLDFLSGLSTNEEERVLAIEAYINSVPEVRAFRYMAERSENTLQDRDRYFRAVALALSSTAMDHAYRLAEYADTPTLKIGIAQVWNLSVSQHFDIDDPNSQAFKPTMARLQRFQRRTADLSDALLAAADGAPLSAAQRALLVQFGFIEEGPNGSYTKQVPVNLQLGQLDDDLALPTRTAWDELLNPWNLAKMAVTLLFPMAVTGTVVKLTVGTALEGTLGGIMVQAAYQSLIFTAISHPLGYGMDAAMGDLRADRPGFLEDYVHNLGIFLSLGAYNSMFRGLPNVRDLYKLTQSQNMAKFLGAGIGTVQISGEAMMFAGMEALSSGEGLTAESFMRNLLMVKMLHAGGKALKRKYKRLEDRITGAAPRTRTQIQGVFDLLPGQARAAEARFRAARERSAPEGKDPAQKLADLAPAERTAIEASLRELGIELDGEAPLPDRTFAAISVLPNGRIRIHIRPETTRADLFNEIRKAQDMQTYGIGPERVFSSEMEAFLEYQSFRAEQEIWRGQPNSTRKAKSIGMMFYWRARLNAIRSGLSPNHALSGPHEGFAVGMDLVRGGRVARYRERHLRTIGATEPNTPDVLKTLKEGARRSIEWASERADSSLAHIEDAVSKSMDAQFQLVQLGESTAPDVQARRAQQTERRDRARSEEAYWEGRLKVYFDRMFNIAQGTARAGRPTPDLRLQFQIGPDQQFDFRSTYDNIRHDYQILLDAKARLIARRADLVARGETARAREIDAEISRNKTQRKNLSKLLGGRAADAAMRRRFPDAEPLFQDEVGGGGSGEVDSVWVVGDRVIVVEAKGGAGKIGTAETMRLHAEQGTIVHTLVTALKMYRRGIDRLGSSDATVKEQGRRLVEAADKLFDGYWNGTLESIVIETKWRIDANGVASIRQTRMRDTVLRWTRTGGIELNAPRAMSLAFPSQAPMPGAFRAGRLTLKTDRAVDIRSDGRAADVSTEADALLRDLQTAVSFGDSVDMLVLPRGAVTVRRTGNVTNRTEVINDPALDRFGQFAEWRAVDVVMGVRFELGPNITVEGALVFGRDGTRQWVERGARASDATVTIDGVDVQIHVGTNVGPRNSPNMPQIVLGGTNRAQLQAALNTLGEGALGVGRATGLRSDHPVIDYVDTSRLAPSSAEAAAPPSSP